MEQALNSVLQFLQQGIAAIFRFIQIVYAWAASQISVLTQVPWQNWPLWKQVLLVLIVVGVAVALFKVVSELWAAGERILAGFGALLGALVRTLPSVALAGVIALGGVWLLNNLDLSTLRWPVFN